MMPVAGVAQAQDVVTGPSSGQAVIGVADRPRSDYLPIGGRLGSFFLYPQLDVTSTYTDNLRATETDQISDETIVVRPSVDLVSNWSRNLLDLRAYYAHAFHVETLSEDFSQYGASALGRLDFARDTHVQVLASADHSVEPRTDINSPNYSRSPISLGQFSLDGNVSQRFNRLTVVLDGNLSHQTYSNGETVTGEPIYQQFRNNLMFSTYAEGRYELGGAASAIVHVERDHISYENNDLIGFDRNSVSYRVEGGVGLLFSNLLKGDLRVGYFTQNNNDARFLDTSGVSFSANLIYDVTPLTTIRLLADRSIEPSGSTVSAGNVRSTVALTVEHELLRNLVVTGFARYAAIDPQGPLDTAHEYEGRLGAIYYLSRRFRFNANYDHYTRRGGATFGDIDVNDASLGVTVSL